MGKMAYMKEGHVYFHSPCFDGVVSAALVTDRMESQEGWSRSCLHVVNYDIRDTWLTQKLDRPAAAVDFLFHPDANFWADHHSTTFLARKPRLLPRNPNFTYDPSADSCAGLLWRHFIKAFGYQNNRLRQPVVWAEKIDAARYESVEEAFSLQAPALRINAALSQSEGDAFPILLVHSLRRHTLSDVAAIPEVVQRYERYKTLTDAGLSRFKRSCWLEEGIVVFDVEAGETLISRYAPYLFFPDALYSAGIIRTPQEAKITVMRNPWREFKSAPLGKFCELFGGGGHERVGAVRLRGNRVTEAKDVLNSILSEIRRHEKQGFLNGRAIQSL